MSELVAKLAIGTAQFGMDYGIANVSGKPTKQEVFRILELAWEKGVRRFDTAPDYGSEDALGEFIESNGLEREIVLLTKLPGLGRTKDCQSAIRSSIESSLKRLACPIEILFLHDPADFYLLLEDPDLFKVLSNEYPVKRLGVSVYEPRTVERLAGCELEIAYQFPLNVLDRRFEQVEMPQGDRYARSIFLQGLLASPNSLRSNAPLKLRALHKDYHERVRAQGLNPVALAISFVAKSDYADFFLIGVDAEKQLQNIFNLPFELSPSLAFIDPLLSGIDEMLVDTRAWDRV